MAEPEEQQRLEDAQNADAAGAADDDEASSPFDHPAFLPVLLWGLAVWFGYDGWINKDPEMLEHVAFNQWGFGILVVLGVYFTIQSMSEVPPSAGLGPVPSKNGVPTCERCNGTSFVPRFRSSTKFWFGIYSLVSRPKHVECVTCGKMYTRPN